MSNEFQDVQATEPTEHHAWLQNLVGDWSVESVIGENEDGTPMIAQGGETVQSLRGLWAHAVGWGDMGNGEKHHYHFFLGFDLTFKEYRGAFVTGMSSHLWKYTGELSEDQKTMTLTCEGPNMLKDGETTWYRDVHHLVSADERTVTSFAQGDDGGWHEFMRATLRRIQP